jgi:UDP-3-O-[3-hydroxymyristoyl] N-acetylglucosamine deacetylase
MRPVEQRGTQRQRTLKAPVRCRGIGLHSGARVNVALHPAAIDAGICFRRSDTGAEIPADWRHLANGALCTTLAAQGSTVATVEHLMAAFAGLEIDNCIVELDGPEVPAMDGSAAPFVFLIDRAGIVTQDAPRRAVTVLKPVRVASGGKMASLEPAPEFSLSFAIDFASNAIRRQEITVAPDPESFRREICRARTFGFLEEVETMRAAGLARGGSLDNAVVISGDRVLNAEGLRYGDEFVRHKVLDAMGDLYLAGGPMIGRFHGKRSGHALNRLLLERLFADPEAWCYATLPAGTDEAWEELPRRALA